jgi:hypothetical protein
MKKSNTFEVSELIHIHEQTVSDMQDLKILLNAVRNELDTTIENAKREHPKIYLPIFDDLKRALKLAICENGSNIEYHFQEAATLREEYSIKQVGEGGAND